MTESKVIVRDLGFNKVVAELQSMGKLRVTAGVHSDAKPRTTGQPNPQALAMFQELGTSTIPARSFIRSTIDARRGQLAQLATGLLRQVADRRIGPEDAANRLGEFTSKAIKAKITALGLVVSGQMRDSVAHKVVNG